MKKELLTPEIIKMAKSLKRQIVEVTPHYICGTDSLTNTFSIIFLDGSVPVDDELYFFGINTELAKYDIYLQNMYSYERFKPKMDYLRSTCHLIENNKILLMADDITGGRQYIIPGFAEHLTKKAKDGATMLFTDMGEFILSSCVTMHPINKSDVVNITAYEYDDVSWLGRFTINKKKYTIYEYIRFLNI